MIMKWDGCLQSPYSKYEVASRAVSQSVSQWFDVQDYTRRERACNQYSSDQETCHIQKRENDELVMHVFRGRDMSGDVSAILFLFFWVVFFFFLRKTASKIRKKTEVFALGRSVASMWIDKILDAYSLA